MKLSSKKQDCCHPLTVLIVVFLKREQRTECVGTLLCLLFGFFSCLCSGFWGFLACISAGVLLSVASPFISSSVSSSAASLRRLVSHLGQSLGKLLLVNRIKTKHF